MPKLLRSRLLAVSPWSASGPGWANFGVTAYYEDLSDDGSLRVREESIQGCDLDAEQVLAWKIGLAVQEVLAAHFEGSLGVYEDAG